MKIAQALAAGLFALVILAGSIALGGVALMALFAVMSGAGFNVPAASFIDSTLIFLLSGFLFGFVTGARNNV